MTLVGLVLGVAVTAIVYGLSLALPQTELFAGLFEGMDWRIALGNGCSLHRVLARPLARRPAAHRALRHDEGRTLPAARLHHPPAHRHRPHAESRPAAAFVLDLAAWASTPTGTVALVAAVLAVMAVLTVLSCMLSVKLYERRGVLSSTPRAACTAPASRRRFCRAPERTDQGKGSPAHESDVPDGFHHREEAAAALPAAAWGMGGGRPHDGQPSDIHPVFRHDFRSLGRAGARALRRPARLEPVPPDHAAHRGGVLGRYAFLAAVPARGGHADGRGGLPGCHARRPCGVPAYAALVLRPGGFDAIGLAWSAAASLALAFVVGGIMLPTFFSFGMGNGPRYAMALVMMVSVLAMGPIVNVWARPEAAPAFLGGLVARRVVRDVPRGGGRLGGERARALRCILRRMPCRLPPARFLAGATGSPGPAPGKGRPCRARRSARLGRRLRRIARRAGARGRASPSSRGRPG